MDCPEIEKIEQHEGAGFVECVAQEITEMMWDRSRVSSVSEGDDGYVNITDMQMINACNHVAVGVFWVGGVEYSFEVESGDRSGFVWRSVSADNPIPEIKIEHTKWALFPTRDIIDAHIANGQAAFLLTKWGLFLERPDVVEICRSYAYDRMFQPGSKTETYWKARAASYGLHIGSEQTSNEVRAWLTKAAKQEAAA